MKSEEVKKLNTSEIKTLFPDPEMRVAVAASVGLIAHLENEIKGIEVMITRKLEIRKEFTKLLTLPGIGQILGLTGGLLLILPVCHVWACTCKKGKPFCREILLS